MKRHQCVHSFCSLPDLKRSISVNSLLMHQQHHKVLSHSINGDGSSKSVWIFVSHPKLVWTAAVIYQNEPIVKSTLSRLSITMSQSSTIDYNSDVVVT